MGEDLPRTSVYVSHTGCQGLEARHLYKSKHHHGRYRCVYTLEEAENKDKVFTSLNCLRTLIKTAYARNLVHVYVTTC